MGTMRKNVTKSQVFEFLRVASLDNTTDSDSKKEAYWMITYLFLMKHQGVDISDSLQLRTANLLKDINLA